MRRHNRQPLPDAAIDQSLRCLTTAASVITCLDADDRADPALAMELLNDVARPLGLTQERCAPSPTAPLDVCLDELATAIHALSMTRRPGIDRALRREMEALALGKVICARRALLPVAVVTRAMEVART